MDYLNTPEKLNRRLVHNPMGRFGEAVEQAKAVVFCESSPIMSLPVRGGEGLDDLRLMVLSLSGI